MKKVKKLGGQNIINFQLEEQGSEVVIMKKLCKQEEIGMTVLKNCGISYKSHVV